MQGRNAAHLAAGCAHATAGTMNETMPDLVSTAWLAARTDGGATGGDLRIVDASRHLPTANRDARAEYLTGHIPGAHFLDLESLVDETSDVPQALPRSDQLSTRLAQLGISDGTAIVLYDDSTIHTAARAWFICRASGIERVAILDGGLTKWRAEGRPLESGDSDHLPTSPPRLSDRERVATKADMLRNLKNQREQVIDARGADRVFGTGEDPVHRGATGRIPGSLNLHYPDVFDRDGTYKSPAELRAAFEAAGLDWKHPVVTTCGSGITAAVLLFAMHLAGKDDVRLYDGSWLEWGSDPDTPKAHGPA